MKTKTTAVIFLAMLGICFVQTFANAEIVKESRTSNPFHAISIKGRLSVRLIQSDIQGVNVEGSGYQVVNTVTMLKNDTLFVYVVNDNQRKKPAAVNIQVGEINSLLVNGASRVDCQGFVNADNISIQADNGAEIKMDIRALKVESKVTGCSSINLSGSVEQSLEQVGPCGKIDTRSMDVLVQKGVPPESCTGC